MFCCYFLITTIIVFDRLSNVSSRHFSIKRRFPNRCLNMLDWFGELFYHTKIRNQHIYDHFLRGIIKLDQYLYLKEVLVCFHFIRVDLYNYVFIHTWTLRRLGMATLIRQYCRNNLGELSQLWWNSLTRDTTLAQNVKLFSKSLLKDFLGWKLLNFVLVWNPIAFAMLFKSKEIL